MNYQNDDLRIKEIKELLPPVALFEKFPATDKAAATVSSARQAIHNILDFPGRSPAGGDRPLLYP